jgi:hypothetical protein
MSCNSNCNNSKGRGCSPQSLPVSNCMRPECIQALKVYDWVVYPTHETTNVKLPDDCREKVERLCREGVPCSVEVTGYSADPFYTPIERGGHCEAPSCKIVKIERTVIQVACQPVDVAIVCLTYSVKLKIVIKKDRSLDCATDEVVCCFDTCVPLWDRVVLCLPEPLGVQNVSTRVLEVDVECGGVFLGGCLDLSIFVCKEVCVEAPVKLEVNGRFCQPRGPIPVPEVTKTRCLPLVRFPGQCNPIFPIERACGSAIACAVNENVIVHVDSNGSTSTGQEIKGTLSLRVDISPEGNPNTSLVTAQFEDTSVAPSEKRASQTFCLEAAFDEVGSPQCNVVIDHTGAPTPCREIFVTGRGRFTQPASNLKTIVSFELRLQSVPGSNTGAYLLDIYSDDGRLSLEFDAVPVTKADGRLSIAICSDSKLGTSEYNLCAAAMGV